MHQVELDHSEEPIRLFKSNFLEFFTHISPITILILWVPVIIYALYRGFVAFQVNNTVGLVAVGYFGGLILWTLAEYVLHRFLFHFKPKTKKQERLAFLFHGVHHAQPKVKTRLVMPPALAIPLALVFYFLFWLVFVLIFRIPAWVGPTFAGFLTGYLIYDIMHYATHHFPMRKGIWKKIKRFHMQHHYKYPDQLFGVSSPLWDYIFATMPKSSK
jgi:sterol desaturase/sphingolipid hydroxylase (fatty acid hydroxylase superfamily)